MSVAGNREQGHCASSTGESRILWKCSTDL
jgi:hypothetical protein